MRHHNKSIETVVHDPNLLRFAASGVLFIIGILGTLGGLSLVLEPNGSTLGLSLNQLTNAPFKNYLIPGILLITVIGIDSLALAYFAYKNLAFSAPLIIIQGIVLIVWLLVEYTYGFVYPIVQIPGVILGVTIIVLGIRLNRYLPS